MQVMVVCVGGWPQPTRKNTKEWSDFKIISNKYSNDYADILFVVYPWIFTLFSLKKRENPLQSTGNELYQKTETLETMQYK